VTPLAFVRRFLPEVCFFGFAAAFACYYGASRMKLPEWEPARFDAVLVGTAPTPFQYRLLLPLTYRAIKDSAAHLPLVKTTRGFRLLVETLTAFCLMLSFRYYLSRCLSCRAAREVTLSMALVLPFNYLTPRFIHYYVYDTPSVLFMLLGLILLYERRWWLFYPLFALATLNRETACFLTLAYLLSADRREGYRRIAVHVLAQGTLWTAIKLCLMQSFAGNPGGLYWYRLGGNLNALVHLQPLARVMSSLGYTWLFVIPWWRRIENRFVRRVTLVAPVHFLAMLWVGKIPEIRIFGEMIPIVLPAYLLVVRAIMQGGPADDGGRSLDTFPRERSTEAR
jgi:hypothetical protein